MGKAHRFLRVVFFGFEDGVLFFFAVFVGVFFAELPPARFRT